LVALFGLAVQPVPGKGPDPAQNCAPALQKPWRRPLKEQVQVGVCFEKIKAPRTLGERRFLLFTAAFAHGLCFIESLTLKSITICCAPQLYIITNNPDFLRDFRAVQDNMGKPRVVASDHFCCSDFLSG